MLSSREDDRCIVIRHFLKLVRSWENVRNLRHVKTAKFTTDKETKWTEARDYCSKNLFSDAVRSSPVPAELEFVGMRSKHNISISLTQWIELLGLFTVRERNTGTETFQLDDKDCKITEMGFSLVISLECCNSLITLTCDLIVTQLETPDSGRNNEFYFPYTFSPVVIKC